MKTPLAALLGVTLLAASARADLYDVKAKLTCYSVSKIDGKLEATNGDSSKIVSIVTGGDPDGLYALEQDIGSGDLQVVQRCDGALLVSLTHDLTCAIGGQSDPKEKLACPFELLDWGQASVNGSLLCLETIREKPNGPSIFNGKCNGALVINDVPCSLSFTFGKPFKPAGACP
jgi:hypothetical protein